MPQSFESLKNCKNIKVKKANKCLKHHQLLRASDMDVSCILAKGSNLSLIPSLDLNALCRKQRTEGQMARCCN